jgi:hypothetical protein
MAKAKTARAAKAAVHETATTARQPARPTRQASSGERSRARLTAELRDIKQSAEVAVESYARSLHQQLDAVIARVEGLQAPAAKQIATLRGRLGELRLKVEKGRAKDLARLRRLAKDLADLLPKE